MKWLERFLYQLGLVVYFIGLVFYFWTTAGTKALAVCVTSLYLIAMYRDR